MPAPTNVRHLSISVEHYTPARIVDAARRTMGGIDLDPASCELANETVRAKRIYTRAEDGFEREWRAETVFLNPPGGKDGNESVQKAWWFKLARAWAGCLVEQAIFIGFSVEILQTSQFEPPAGAPLPLDFPLCFPATRVAYDRASEAVVERQVGFFDDAAPETSVVPGTQPPHASVFAFLPPRWRTLTAITDFRRHFEPMGRVVVPTGAWSNR